MYYNGKSDFYFKQYGIPILTLAFSIFLVGSGVYVYWASSTSHTSTEPVIVASDKLQEIDEQTKPINSVLGSKLENLKSLEKSEEGTITEVKENGSVMVKFEDKEINVNLLGIDMSKPSDKLLEKIKEDLLNKEVKLSFEDERIINNNVYAYIYIDDTSLYNEDIIETGLAKIDMECKNLAYQDDLIQAQAYAKQLARGVWKR